MDGEQSRGPTPPVPVPPLVQESASSTSRPGSRSDSGRGSRSLKSLTRLLGDEREAKEWKELIQKLHNQLQLERRRAEDAERRVLEIASHLKSVNDSRLQALQDVARLNEELKLYEMQFDKAQKEIYRAQDVLKIVDDQRYRAEQDAAKARSTARKLKEEITIYEAREEGRRLGLQEGLRKGREMGYQEGRRMAEAGRARRRSDRDGSLDEESSDSHAPDRGETVESQVRSQTHSVAPSNASSRIPTVHSEAPPTAAPAPPHNAPVRPVPPIPEDPENIRPRNVRSASPSPRMPTSSAPPDNYIPNLDEGGRIRLPPAFEFSRSLPSPERQHSPVLPTTSENEEPRMIPPPVSRRSQHYRPTSLVSASTTLSQLDMVNDPYVDHTPMSVIPEVLSAQGSPHPQGTSIRRQTSIGTQSSRMSSRTPTNLEPFYGRPRADSGSTISVQPPPVIPGSDLRASVSTTSTTPNITVQPPSVPISRFTSMSGGHAHDPSRPVGSSHSEPNDSEPFFPPIPETSPQPTEPVPLPDHLPMRSAYATNTSIDSANQPPVIPHPDLYTNPDDDDDDVVSSGMESMESLTTPPGARGQHQRLPSRDRVADASASVAGSSSGYPSENHWAGIARMAAHEPIRPVVPPATYPSAASNARTPSTKGRPLSRSTNRSGR